MQSDHAGVIIDLRGLRTEGQSVRKIEVTKTIKRYDETGSHEDRPRKGRPRVASAEDKLINSSEPPASEIAS